MAESVVHYLKRVHDQGCLKGGDATRTTREVADACGLRLGTARSKLWSAYEAGEVDAFDGGASGARGNEICWQAKQGAAPRVEEADAPCHRD